ncbi:MAG: phosphatase PAP2 family protein [Betaproteobacteria bacterium]
MRDTPTAIARSLSILGHPLVVVPAAIVTLALNGRTSSAALLVSAVCGVSGVVLAYSLWQVHLGKWQHVDASSQAERRSLNIFLSIVLFLAAAAAFFQIPESGLSPGMFLSGLLIVTVMLASPWAKLSLHASFAAFAVVLLWPLNYWYVAIASVVAASICWSRVMLARHTLVEVLGGSFLGALFGVFFWIVPWSHG